jgi:hypothetical protein
MSYFNLFLSLERSRYFKNAGGKHTNINVFADPHFDGDIQDVVAMAFWEIFQVAPTFMKYSKM